MLMHSRKRALLTSAPNLYCCRRTGYNKGAAGAFPILRVPPLHGPYSCSVLPLKAPVTTAMHHPESTPKHRSTLVRLPSLTPGRETSALDPNTRVDASSMMHLQAPAITSAEEKRPNSCPPNMKQSGSSINLPWRGKNNTINLGNGNMASVLARSLSPGNAVHLGLENLYSLQRRPCSMVQGVRSETSVHTLRFTPTSPRDIQHSTSVMTGSHNLQQCQGDTGVRVNCDVQDTPLQTPSIKPTSSIKVAETFEQNFESATSNTFSVDDKAQSTLETKHTQPNDSEYSRKNEEDKMTEEDNSVETDEGEIKEKHIPLTYQIPEDKLRAAMQASPNTRACYWSQRLYVNPEGERLSTHYLRDFATAERVAKYFLKEKVIGFDIEWKPWASKTSIKQNASLIQLACEDRIALFHISQFKGTTIKELVPPTLRTVLESPDILKVGVAVKGDFSRLEKYLDIHARGVFELSRLHNLVEFYAVDRKKVTHKLVSLAKQVHHHLQLPLYKGEKLDNDDDSTESVRESDWSKALNMDQIQYASADAYAGFRLFDVLEAKRKQLKHTPPWPRMCDDDPKPPPPKEKASTVKSESKKPKAQVAAEPASTAENVENMKDPAQDAQEDDPVEEELMDSHELEDSEDDGAPEAQKRVGRVNLSRLRDPDPGYPSLPSLSDEDADADGSAAFDPPPQTRLSRPSKEKIVSHSLLEEEKEDVDDDDEYADPELEKALVKMAIDSDGKIKEVVDDIPATSRAQAASGMAPLPGAKLEPSADQISVSSNQCSPPSGDSTRAPPLTSASTTTATTTPTFKSLASNLTEHTSEFTLATTWAQTYLSSTIPPPTSKTVSRIRATIPPLRAYHLWHCQKLPVAEISKHLRDPPLAQSTVCNYILQAISLERLEYRNDDLRDVLQSLPISLRKGRWEHMSKRVGRG